MESRKELDLNQLPSDDEQPFQAYAYANHITPTEVENETNQVPETEWKGYYPRLACQTLTYVQALEAGQRNPTKLAGVARAFQTKTTTIALQEKVSRGPCSWDLEPKLKSPVKISPRRPGLAITFYRMQQVEAQPLQQQKLDTRTFQMQQLDTQPLQQQKVAAQPLQRQKFDAQPFQPQPLYAQPFQMQQLYARLLQEQQVVAQPQQTFQPQQLYKLPQPYALLRQQQQISAQTFQRQQQHPSSSAAKAEPACGRDRWFENIKRVGNIEHPLPESTFSIPCKPYCPYIHVKSRLENHDVFEYSKYN